MKTSTKRKVTYRSLYQGEVKALLLMDRLRFSGEVRRREMTYAVSAAFTIGGQSAACVLKRYEA